MLLEKRAFVLDGEFDLKQIKTSTKLNQFTCLQRTPDDKRKPSFVLSMIDSFKRDDRKGPINHAKD